VPEPIEEVMPCGLELGFQLDPEWLDVEWWLLEELEPDDRPDE
jgi:hypothetical protein